MPADALARPLLLLQALRDLRVTLSNHSTRRSSTTRTRLRRISGITRSRHRHRQAGTTRALVQRLLDALRIPRLLAPVVVTTPQPLVLPLAPVSLPPLAGLTRPATDILRLAALLARQGILVHTAAWVTATPVMLPVQLDTQQATHPLQPRMQPLLRLLLLRLPVPMPAR